MKNGSMQWWAAMLVAAGLAGCGSLPSLPTMNVVLFPRLSIPADIAAPPGEKLTLIAVGNGVQVYRCDAKPGGGNEWAPQGAETTLRDPAGRYIGKLSAGPTWELEGGAKIVATVDARRAAPESSAIPWLRMKATPASVPSSLAGVSTVLRVATVGGVPPSSCADYDRGRILRIGYSADYYFYVRR